MGALLGSQTIYLYTAEDSRRVMGPLMRERLGGGPAAR